ncbi:MAG: LPS assembly protein LptD, partial [Thermodesulfobacteriota bacterium]
SEYLYGYTEDSLRGHRTDIHPRIALPGRVKNFFSFEPSLGVRETFWQVERYGEESGEDRARSRELYDARLEMASELYRVFDLNPETGERLCHTIVPQVRYDYVPEKDQDTYPRFDDSIDIIEAANTVTYSVTNLLTFKGWQEAGAERETPPQAGEAEAAQSPAEALQPSRTAFYREAARLKLSQSYDINEAGEDDPAKWQNPERRQPFSPVLAELDLRPSSFFRFDGDARWEPYAGKWTGYTGELAFSDARGDEFSGGYRYKQNASESVYGAATLVINDAFSLYADYERNIFQHMDILAKFGVIYRSSCWSVDVSYADEPDDRTYLVMFTLYGLGEIGTDISGADIESYP